jgi:hypothetical protein
MCAKKTMFSVSLVSSQPKYVVVVEVQIIQIVSLGTTTNNNESNQWAAVLRRRRRRANTTSDNTVDRFSFLVEFHFFDLFCVKKKKRFVRVTVLVEISTN